MLKMSGTVKKALKFKLEGPDVDVQYKNFVIRSDTDSITKFLTTAVGVVGVEGCLKLGTAAAAIYFVVKSMLKNWPWMQVSNVNNDNVLEIEIPKKHEDNFNEMVAKGMIAQNVNNDFKNIGTNLEGVIGKDVCENRAQEVKKLIENVRVTAVQSCNEHKSESVIAADINEGTNRDIVINSNTRLVVREQKAGTTIAGKITKNGAVSEGIKIGENTCIVVGYQSEEANELLKTSNAKKQSKE